MADDWDVEKGVPLPQQLTHPVLGNLTRRQYLLQMESGDSITVPVQPEKSKRDSVRRVWAIAAARLGLKITTRYEGSHLQIWLVVPDQWIPPRRHATYLGNLTKTEKLRRMAPGDSFTVKADSLESYRQQQTTWTRAGQAADVNVTTRRVGDEYTLRVWKISDKTEQPQKEVAQLPPPPAPPKFEDNREVSRLKLCSLCQQRKWILEKEDLCDDCLIATNK